MGTGPPAFTEVDNPASFADSLFVRVSYEVAFCWPAQNICLCHRIEFSVLLGNNKVGRFYVSRYA